MLQVASSLRLVTQGVVAITLESDNLRILGAIASGEEATGDRVAGIVSADVLVVATCRRVPAPNSGLARVVGASVVVVAGVGRELASEVSVALVERAGVVVLAHSGGVLTSRRGSVGVARVDRAGVTVITVGVGGRANSSLASLVALVPDTDV